MHSEPAEKATQLHCYHCGETCRHEAVYTDDKPFCCEGCRLVYELLKDNNLCTYYTMNRNPGGAPAKPVQQRQYEYLDHEEIARQLIRFRDEERVHVTFYIPSIHCSSCIWLLENLHRLNKQVISATVNFPGKEVSIVFESAGMKLSEVATLLAHTGYEPLISLDDLQQKATKKNNRSVLLKIGIAGFCFGNSMMLSFPEYFSLGSVHVQAGLRIFFGYLNLALSLPVFFYCASGFFTSAWKSIRHRYLNIDAPIALAILVTFSRSVYEIISHTGAGYTDSMSGIVFFMLLGRYFQNRTYETLSFERDYKSYFPVGVTLLRKQAEVSVPVTELKKGDRILIRNNELIPADAILLSRRTHIDYSFITGESLPVTRRAGELIYAGGRQQGGAAVLEVAKPVSQSYLTELWNRDIQSASAESSKTYVDTINRYFTATVLSIAALAALYWAATDSSKLLNAFTAVLIVACPCGLLLTTTFANGNLLRIMGRNRFYLKNAAVIGKLAGCDTILFDKTGTITQGAAVQFTGTRLTAHELALLCSLAAQSSHPLSRRICEQYGTQPLMPVTAFEELPGKGIRGNVNGSAVQLGSAGFTIATVSVAPQAANVFLRIDGELMGCFSFSSDYRPGLEQLVQTLAKDHHLKLLSGDNDSEKAKMEILFGKGAALFHQKPEDKMQEVLQLQANGHRVLMIGDGLNDAAALRRADAGIAVSDNTNTFSPACDAILQGSAFTRLPSFIALAKVGKKVILATFIISLMYNLVGLSYAVTGTLSPVVAAVLMPLSSVSIVVLTTVGVGVVGKLKGL